MRFLGFGLLIFLLCSPQGVAQSGPPLSFSFWIEDNKVTLEHTERELGKYPLEIETTLVKIEKNIFPEILNVLSGKIVSSFRLHLILSNEIPHNYCGWVPKDSIDTIYISLDCIEQGQGSYIFAHEFWHILSNQQKTDGVHWLNEGLAELFASRITGIYPDLAWRRFFTQGRLVSIVTAGESHEHQHYRLDAYASSHLFLLYLYEHFGQDEFLIRMLEAQKEGVSGISQTVHRLSNDSKYSGFNSLFLNYAMALSLNSPMHAENLLFQLVINQNYGELKSSFLTPSFTLLENQYNEAFYPYEVKTLRLVSDSSCLLWTSNRGRQKVYRIHNGRDVRSLKEILPDSCFHISGMEYLVIVNFEVAAEIQFTKK